MKEQDKMKKLMIAAAALAVGFAANASQVSWGTASGTTATATDGTTLLGSTSGYWAYLMVDSVTKTGSETVFTRDDAIAAINKGDVSFLDDNAGARKNFYKGALSGSASSDVFADNNTVGLYMVIVDAQDYADVTKAWVSTVQSGVLDEYGTSDPIKFDVTGTHTPENWMNVPEPTSGLLLLLGVAGLALRRRRA